uniref:Stringent starvation protein B n=1 Tax=OCS116 cluster bacterium TaxID=2030921 RepID=A0A2A4YS03_9PROT
MTIDLMNYDQLTQDAMRSVVKRALEHVVEHGLPGDHHFYVSFDTNFPGVVISETIYEQYPDEMTIVIQHQFWGLEVKDGVLRIELSFNNVPEKLEIPLMAIIGFFDPHVQFGIQFEIPEEILEAIEVLETEKAEDKEKTETKTDDDKTDNTDDDDKADKGAQVVSLDAFRKKTD